MKASFAICNVTLSKVAVRRIVVGASALAFLVACESPARVAGTQSHQTPQDVPNEAPAARAVTTLYGITDTASLVVGAARMLWVEAYDDQSDHVSTDQAVVSSSDSSVVQVAEARVVSMTDARGRAWKELYQVLRFVGPGTADVAVTLGNRSDNIQVFVGATPTNRPALVVQSFTVVEYRVHCGAGWCPYLLYAPLLELHEPTGATTVEIVSVEFTLGNHTTGVCRGSVFYAPGASAFVDGIDDYPWSNDLIFASIDGTALPGDATAHVLMRDAQGNYSELTATTTVQRMVSNPTFPPPRGTGWMCL
jgi:hypothetical protein